MTTPRSQAGVYLVPAPIPANTLECEGFTESELGTLFRPLTHLRCVFYCHLGPGMYTVCRLRGMHEVELFRIADDLLIQTHAGINHYGGENTLMGVVRTMMVESHMAGKPEMTVLRERIAERRRIRTGKAGKGEAHRSETCHVM
jgi:hypothetical protein